MARIEAQRRSATQWQALVVRQANSGESVRRFCAREGLSAASFYQWRSRSRSEGVLASSAMMAPRTEASFVDLGALRAEPERSGRMVLRLDLGCGVVLEIRR